ncbi:MAG TPA: GAF domain-containing protein, partial [Isosphaeraceae bacterium]
MSERKEAEATIAEQMRLAEYGREIGAALTRDSALGEMLALCAEVTVRHLDAAFVRIWTSDDANQVLELQASAGMYTHIDGEHARIPVGTAKIGQIAQERRPHLSHAVVGDARVHDQDWARREGMVAFAGYPLVVEDRLVGVLAGFARHDLSDAALRMLGSVANEIAVGIERKRAEGRLAEQTRIAETLHRIGGLVAAELDLKRLVQVVTDEATRLTDAQFGAFFYNIIDLRGEAYTLYTISGVPREAFARFPMPRNTDLFGPTFRNEGIVRLDDVTRDPRYGRNAPYQGMPEGHLPVRSYLAVPVVSRSGGVLGGLFFGHAEVGVFSESDERIVAGIAAQAAVAIDNARLYREAQDSGQRFRQLAENISAVFWMQETRGPTLLYVSPAYEAIWGRSCRSLYEAPGSYIDAVHPEDRDLARAARARHDLGEPTAVEYRIVRPDGSMRWVWDRGFPIKDEAGRVIRVAGIAEDITERKRVEAELRAAKEEAEEANKAKTQFLAVLSHELRTPLNPILLACSAMLERASEPEELRPTLEMIRQNVHLQARLIDDLLDVMRIVRGKMPLHWEVADCHRLLDQAIRICQSEVFGKELRMEVDLAAANRHVNADSARLQQVFWNLIKNAVKFTPEGGTIAIGTRNVADPAGRDTTIVVEVADTGIGIEPEVLPKVFDPFQQGETTITRKFGGLGLGLAICRGIVDAHG